MNKLQLYIEDQIKAMKNFFPNVSEDILREKIKAIVKNNEVNNPIKNKYSFEIRYNDDETPNVSGVKVNTIEKLLNKDKPIICKSGCCFYRQDENASILAKMLIYLFDMRKKVKNEMLKHVNDKDQTLHDKLDMIQKTIKILMNSFKLGGLFQ